MRIVPALIATCLTFGAFSHGEEPQTGKLVADGFFERLDSNGDGEVTVEEAPEQGKMLVEFLLNHSGKASSARPEPERLH